jgi:hypothetical protein
MRTNIVTSSLYFVTLILFVSCANNSIKNQEENLRALKSDDVAAVIGGCRFTDGDKKSSCHG